MALPLSQIPVSSSFLRRTILPKISSRIKPTPIFTQSIKYTSTNRNNKFFIITATKEENSESETVSTQQSPPNEPPPPQPTSNRSDYTGGGDDLSELGSEIKKAMKEREEKGGGGFWGGVAEEIGEIEWPPFNKVLGTTGVVLGVIAGSSVVLLTLNAVLAELSDRVFAGRGVQDFFG